MLCCTAWGVPCDLAMGVYLGEGDGVGGLRLCLLFFCGVPAGSDASLFLFVGGVDGTVGFMCMPPLVDDDG